MELELKYLSAYLPYGLEVIYTHTREIGKIKNLYDIEYYDDIKIGINWMDGEHIWMFKPILRPLSDLTKEIEHNGEKFVPALQLVKLKEKYGKWKDIAPTIDYDVRIVQKPFGKALKVTKCDQWVIYMSLNEIERQEYFIVQKLLEWHFDVFGLIEKDLAIDINALNK